MAEASISVGQDQFTCSVCLDLLKDPATIPCGHSYCMSCITGCWNQEDQKGVYSCPQCRQTFSPRPVLGKNTILAEMVEKLKKTKIQVAVPAESGDVVCDVCTGRKRKAVKSCLVCLESYCQIHFDRHEEFRSGNPHKVIDATGRLQKTICPQHHKILEIYCLTDKCCICYLCTMDKHKQHKTITAEEERTIRQRELEKTQKQYQEKILNREKNILQLRANVNTHKDSAQKAVEDSEKTFTELISFIERSCSKVVKLIRDQEKTKVSKYEERLKKLEQETDDLRTKNAELELLSCTDDHIHFLQSFPQGYIRSLPFPMFPYFESGSVYNDIGKSVALLKEKIEVFCSEEIEKLSVQHTARSATTAVTESQDNMSRTPDTSTDTQRTPSTATSEVQEIRNCYVMRPKLKLPKFKSSRGTISRDRPFPSN